MTNSQFKNALQSELNADHISFRNPIKTVDEIGVNTVIIFTYPTDVNTRVWLNKRFSNGIKYNDSDLSTILLNTPNEITPVF